MPCRSNLDLTPAAFISLPPYNSGLPIPLFNFKPPQDGQLSINTLEGWTALVARTKKKAASSDCNTGSGGDQPEGQSKNQTHYETKKNKSQVSVLKEKRMERGWSQMDVTRALGLSGGRICHWEQGDQVPSESNLLLLAELFGCTVDDLGFSLKARPESKLRELRLKRGLNQSEVAKAIGASCGGTVCRWEEGKGRPSDMYLHRLAEFFHCTIRDLGFSLRKFKPLATEERNRLVEQHLPIIRKVINRNWPLVAAVRMSYEDLYQDLAMRMVKAVDSYRPDKGTLSSHIITALEWELKTSAAIASAHGIKGAPRDLRPVFFSVEAMAEAGMQLSAEAM